MRKLLLIGIGAGDPEYLTVAAVNAMNEVDVFFVMDKGPAAAELVEARRALCARFIRKQTYRFVEVPDPPRDRTAEDYRPAVEDWRRRRADVYERLIRDELGDEGCGAFLIWGDPSLYDGTLEMVALVARGGRVAFDYEVIPGISSVQALAARHRIPLTRPGGAVQITTGRLLAGGWPDADNSGARSGDADNSGTGNDTTGSGGTGHPAPEDVVVMLDSASAWHRLAEAGPDLDISEVDIYWGAYLGTGDELLVSGPLTEAGPRIEAARARARAEHGWIMDTYLLRRRPRRSRGAGEGDEP